MEEEKEDRGLPDTQTQEYVESSQEIQIQKALPWGRLCSLLPSLPSVDLFDLSYSFGRSPSCNIFVDSDQIKNQNYLNVSKEHFRLDKEDEMVSITDLSKNGTFLNKRKIGKFQRLIICNNDNIGIGPTMKIYSFTSNVNLEGQDFPDELTEKYFIAKRIGRGAFGQVRLAYDKKSTEKFAIKIIHKPQSSSNSSASSQKIKTEVEILTTFSHAFIIKMTEVFETPKDVFLVLEYMEGGELTGKILSSKPFPESEVKFIFYQILLAVRYLHLNGITHRDLKPENVLLLTSRQFPMVKVSDFGLSKIMDEISLMQTTCGTISYVAPEILRGYEPYNKKVDIWSLGVILFYMLTKCHPFAGSEKESIARKIRAGKIPWDNKAWRGVSGTAKDLTRRMLTLNPDVRIATAEVFRQEWIEKDVNMRTQIDQLTIQTFEDTDSSEERFLPKRPRLTNF